MRQSIRLHLYHLHLLILHVGAIAAIYRFETRWLLGSLAVYCFLQIAGGNIALHRYFSHGSFKTGPWRERFLVVVGNLTCLGSSLSWVVTHRHHHRFADQPEDCHSPAHLSVPKILLGYWNPADDSAATLRRLPLLHWHTFIHRFYFPLHFVFAALLCWADWRWFIYLYALPNLLVFYALYAVVIFCHRGGYRNFSTADHSYNNRWVAWATFGEGWHNNHHQYPLRHRNTIRAGEWDPTARVIELIFKRSETETSR